MAKEKVSEKSKRPSGGLKSSARRKSATIKPDAGHPAGRFPMPDKAHARNALARLNQAKGLSSGEKKEIKARAKRIIGHATPPTSKKGSK